MTTDMKRQQRETNTKTDFSRNCLICTQTPFALSDFDIDLPSQFWLGLGALKGDS